MSGIFGTTLSVASLTILNAQGLSAADHAAMTVLMCNADGSYVEIEIPMDDGKDEGDRDQCATACHAMSSRSRNGDKPGDHYI